MLPVIVRKSFVFLLLILLSLSLLSFSASAQSQSGNSSPVNETIPTAIGIPDSVVDELMNAATGIRQFFIQIPFAQLTRIPDDSFTSSETIASKLKGSLLDDVYQISPQPVRVNVMVYSNSFSTIEAHASALQAVVKNRFSVGNILTLEIPSDKLMELAQLSQVKSIWPDRVFHTNLDSSVPQIHAPDLWAAGYTGTGVKVAVLDTGINSTHPMLVGRVPVEQSFTGEPSNDVLGHGTHVAGIIGGKINGANTYNGVAPDSTLWNIKVLDNTGHGAESWIVNGINYAVDPDNNPATDDGVDVINMSFGGPYTDPNSPIVAAVEAAIQRGVVVVIASGNCGPGCPSGDCQGFVGVETPGDAPNAITVGAVDDASQWACFSSGGFVNNGQILKPDVVAPGVNITSSSLNSSTATLSGTSMAAPHVSGVAALLLQANPSISPQNVKDILEQTASDFGDPGKDSQYGSGLIDASQMLPSSVLTFLKYKLTQSASVVDKGNPVSFTITSTSNDVQSIVLDVNAPNQLITNVPLTQNGLSWNGSFSSTTQIGTHLVTATVTNVAGDITVLKRSFAVKAPSTTGALLSNDLPAQAFHGQPLVVNVQFQNTGSFDTEALVELQEWKEDYFERNHFSSVVPVSAGQTIFIPVNWTPLSTLGNKTIKLVAVFDDTALEVDQNVLVEDQSPPVIWNITSPSTSTSAQPIVVSVFAGDLTPLSGTIHVTSPFVQDIPLTTRFDSDFNRTLHGTIEPTQTGNISYTIELCDSASTPHCVTSAPQSVNVSVCTVPKSLVVLGSGSPSDFNFLSPSTYCLGFWENAQQTPSLNFLNSFPFVYWSAGSSYSGAVDENAASILQHYSGDLVLEGDDIAQRHGNDSFMSSLAHAQFKDSFFIDENSSATIPITHAHYIFQNLSSPLPLSLSQKSAWPDIAVDTNGGVPLASWDTNGSAIIGYEKNGQKNLFIGFNTKLLSSVARETFIQNIFSWAFVSGGPDLNVLSVQTYFSPQNVTLGTTPSAEIYTPYLIAGANGISFTGSNIGNQTATNVPYEISIDGVSAGSQVKTINAGQNKRFIINTTLTAGDHNLGIHANPTFNVVEPNTLNNDARVPIWVAPVLPNAVVLDINTTHSNNLLTVTAYVSNYGGTTISNMNVRFSIDGVTQIIPTSLNPGDIATLFATYSSPRKNFAITVIADPTNVIAEANETDNTLNKTAYFCTKQNILIVNDDDAQIYWADEDFDGNPADLNASSAFVFEKQLKDNGFCTTVWNESTQGVPSSIVLNQYPVVVWSTGDYWSQVIDTNDEAVIRAYTGSTLFEGNDIGFDHADDNFMVDILRADMNSDVFTLSSDTNISLNPVFYPNLASIDINTFNASFADSVTPLNGGISAGTWAAAKDAVILYPGNGYRTAYMGFSLDSIATQADLNTFLSRTIDWLLQASNLPPSPPSSLLCNGAACSGNYANSISLACSGSTDPESDAITYSLEAALSDSAPSSWWDTNWSHRIPIDINMSGTQSNFRTSVDINTSLITDTVFWSHVKSDFSDVRFVYNGVPLKYYRPVYGDNSFASFWIEFDAVPGVNTIDMYFGNTSAAYVGKNNPTEFFLTGPWHLVDDFDDGVMSGWTTRSGTWQESGGIMQRTGSASSEDQITKDWLQSGSSFYIRAQARPTGTCINTEIALTRDLVHVGPTYLDEFFGMSVDNACPNGFLYTHVDTGQSTIEQSTASGNQVAVDNKTEVLISRTGWMGAFIADANASAFKKASGWESMDHTFPYLSIANYGGPHSEADEIYTGNAPNHAYDLGLTFGAIQTPSSGGSNTWQVVGTHLSNASYAWDVSALGTHANVGLRCRATDLSGSVLYSAYYTADQNVSLN